MYLPLPLTDPLFPDASFRFPIDNSGNFFLSVDAATPFSLVAASARVHIRFTLSIDDSPRAPLTYPCAWLRLPDPGATDLARLLICANIGGTACCAACPCRATAKRALFMRKQPKQNLADLG